MRHYDLKAEIDITGSPKAVATGRITKLKNSFTDNQEYIDSLFIVNSEEDFTVNSFKKPMP